MYIEGLWQNTVSLVLDGRFVRAAVCKVYSRFGVMKIVTFEGALKVNALFSIQFSPFNRKMAS